MRGWPAITLMMLAWLIIIAFLIQLPNANAQSSLRNNVIVIIADDLSPFYLDPNHPVKMPNVKNLAKRGTEFTNSHAAYSSCGPSRMAFMTGRYPVNTRLLTFERWVPQVNGLKTMAQYLADRHGYQTTSWGKVFHDDKDPTDPHTIGMFQAGLWTDRQKGGGSSDGECNGRWFCSFQNEARSGDYQLSRAFAKFLHARNKSRPLLAFVGFRKPHMEVGVPRMFLQQRPNGAKDKLIVTQPSSLNEDGSVLPYNKSLQFFECYYEILGRTVDGLKAFPATRFLQSRYSHALNDIRSHYFAASRYVDTLIGYVVNQVDSDPAYSNNTAIVFISDHGFSNGEHNYFCKNTLFEQATRTAFVVAPAKNMKNVDRGRVRTEPISLVDLFPTVVHLATGNNLPRKATVDSSNLPLDGHSVIQNDRAVLSVYTYSVLPRCQLVHSLSKWQCNVAFTPCGRLSNPYIGYMIRTQTDKYIEWRHFNDTIIGCSKPDWPGLTPAIRNRMMAVNQIDPTLTRTDWNQLPMQREMYDDLPGQPDAQWGQWELSNVLTDRRNDTAAIIKALEYSAAIRWKFDANFAGATEPCNGNGYVRLADTTKWKSFKEQPLRKDLACQCLAGFSGPECGTVL